jgi:hypothetical protein
MAGLKTPARLAQRLAELTAVPSRGAPAIASRLAALIPPPPLGSVAVVVSGGEIRVTQTRPHGPPVASVLPEDGLPSGWAAAIADETGKSVKGAP